MSHAENDSAEPWAQEDVAGVLATRATVEQAKGILMERYDVDADAAFAVLTRHSQHTNRKLRDIAEDLVNTGQLPDDPTGANLHSI